MSSLQTERWLLPEGTEEVLPEQAWYMEHRRRRVLDLFRAWGYELVRPPLAEFRDALLTGIGAELANDTVTVTDPLSGRLMGIRADMTPQVARIEAHYLRDEGLSRLCYAGPTLFARPGVRASREPLQCGVELFGSASPSADCEIIELMVASVSELGLSELTLDIGHMGLFNALINPMDLSDTMRAGLIGALQRKSREDVTKLATEGGLDKQHVQTIVTLLNLSGDVDIVNQARESFPSPSTAVSESLDNLEAVTGQLSRRLPNVQLNIDLSELRGYRYHTGVIFSLFTPGYGQPVARGGRYDNIGLGFGRSRPATGFSTDLRMLDRLDNRAGQRLSNAICAPWSADKALIDKVQALRTNGESVIWLLPEQTIDDVKARCDRQLVEGASGWELVVLT